MEALKKPKILSWTAHSRMKMRFYRLSEGRVKRVLHTPKRVEEGIAPKTIAMMQPAGSAKHPYEIWVMFQDAGQRRKVISAWKYPGKTKSRDEITRELLTGEYREFLGQGA